MLVWWGKSVNLVILVMKILVDITSCMGSAYVNCLKLKMLDSKTSWRAFNRRTLFPHQHLRFQLLYNSFYCHSFVEKCVQSYKFPATSNQSLFHYPLTSKKYWHYLQIYMYVYVSPKMCIHCQLLNFIINNFYKYLIFWKSAAYI
jgi:hypothetical protein